MEVYNSDDPIAKIKSYLPSSETIQKPVAISKDRFGVKDDQNTQDQISSKRQEIQRLQKRIQQLQSEIEALK